MDLEAIERALEKTKCRLDEYTATEIGTPNERMRHSLLMSACEEIAVFHVGDLLRILRAIAWMEEHKAELVMVGDDWVCEGIAWEDVPYTGQTVIDAIEAAMQSK